MKNSLFILLALGLTGLAAHAEVKLAALFGDHMVLQRDASTAIWGTAAPSEEVKVTVGSISGSAKAGADGKWIVKLEKLPLTATGIDVTVAGSNTITLHDVLVGDVWVCSGQSNMAFTFAQASTVNEDAPKANLPTVRLFMVKPQAMFTPQADTPPDIGHSSGLWVVCTPDMAKRFSAVGYYFGSEIAADEKVPVGLIGTYWGGTTAQAWTSLDGLESVPELATKFGETVKPLIADPAAAQKAHDDWLANGGKAFKEASNKYRMAQYAAQKKGEAFNDPKPTPPAGTEPPCQADDKQNGDPGVPSSLYNGMIAPLEPLAIKGAIWYQGESGGSPYGVIFPNMITDWRKHWGIGDFPFLFVQLPNYTKASTDPNSNNGWPMTREAQLDTLKLPNTGMAVTIEVGDPNNLHPPYKQPVGHRLALAAEQLAYGEKIVGTSPLFDSATPNGDKLVVKFKDTGTGLKIGQSPVTPPGATPLPITELKGFAVAGADGKYVWAKATITGPDTVTVSGDGVASPVTVRYAWNSSPDANLYNSADLPASPFRTDTQPQFGGAPMKAPEKKTP